MKLRGEFREVFLHPVTDNENDFADALRIIESLPGVGDDRTPGDFEQELVHVRTHAGALAGGDEDGGVHRG